MALAFGFKTVIVIIAIIMRINTVIMQGPYVHAVFGAPNSGRPLGRGLCDSHRRDKECKIDLGSLVYHILYIIDYIPYIVC